MQTIPLLLIAISFPLPRSLRTRHTHTHTQKLQLFFIFSASFRSQHGKKGTMLTMIVFFGGLRTFLSAFMSVYIYPMRLEYNHENNNNRSKKMWDDIEH